jgi:NADPH2:quinone reductase
MKAVWYEKLGAANEVLQFGEVEAPQPDTGEVLVRIEASGVNPVDTKRRLGGRGEIPFPRVIPHLDGAGVIEKVGSGVDTNRVGQRVWLYEAQGDRPFGSAAEYVAIPAERAVPLPEGTSFDEGASLGVPAMTAHAAVFTDGDVSGQTLLVTGGAGVVGRYAIQFAKLSGARVITTVSNEEKAAIASSAGADLVLNYRTDDVAAGVQEFTAGQGVDRIVEVEFGGNLETSLKCLKTGGVIATYASQAVPEPTIPFYTMLYQHVVVRHVLVLHLSKEAKQQAIDDINHWLQAGSLTHNMGQKFTLAETVAAHQAVEGGAVGKVIVKTK